MKVEQITQKRIKELFEYKEGKLYWRIQKSNRIKIGDRAGHLGNENYRKIRMDNCLYLEHRLIWLMFKNYLPKELDHINGIRNDNRIENLREVNRNQNQWNRKKNKKGTSKYKGVYWNKELKKWRVEIQYYGTPIYLGDFDSEIEAAKAYNKKCEELFKEYAHLNKIESDLIG